MDIEIRNLGKRGTEILPSGRLEADSLDELRAVLLDPFAPRQKLLVNLEGVESIDSAGMALLMMTRVELEASGIRFVVEASNPAIARALMAAGLPRFVSVAPRRLDALRALGEEAEPEAVERDLGLDRAVAGGS